MGKFGLSVYRERAQHAWSSSWIRCVVPSRNRKAESDIIPLHNSPASIVRESRLWSARYGENCCREREPYPRTFSQPQEVPKHLAALDDAEFGDVLFYNSGRWPSRRAFLEIFAALLPHIVSFLKEIGHPVAHLEYVKFRVRLCVLTDIFGHLNKVNLLLQGRHKLLCNLHEAAKGFEDKVTLFKVHAEGGNFLHFKFTRKFCGEDDERIEDA